MTPRVLAKLDPLAHDLVPRVKWERPQWRKSLGQLLHRLWRDKHLSAAERDWLWYRVVDLYQEAYAARVSQT